MTMFTESLRVLYVEDNPVDIDLARRELLRLSPQIRLESVATLSAAYDRLGEDPAAFDVVLTDLRLPDGSGLELLGWVRQRELPVAVVIITGHGDEEAAVSALKAGADDYLVKRPELFEKLPVVLAAAYQGNRRLREKLSKPLLVLYAEPNPLDGDLTRRFLSRHAPRIRLDLVSSGAEALASITGTGEDQPLPCDVLLLDLCLPGLGALEVVKEVRQERRLDLPIVLVTGRGSEEVAVQALRLGADDYIVKHDGYLQQLPSVLEKVQKQAELNRSEQRYRLLSQEFHALLDAIPDSLMLLDRQLKVLWSNRAGSEEIASTAAETPFTPRDDRAVCTSCYNRSMPCVRCLVLQSFDSGIPKEETVVRQGGRCWNIRTVPLKDEQGSVTRVIELKRDVTEQKRAEERLRESERKYRQLNEVLEQRVKEAVDELRQKDQILIQQGRQAVMGEMISNIAHQWRQPLNLLALLLQELQIHQKQERLTSEMIQDNVSRSLQIIKEMSKTIDYFRFFFKSDQAKSEFRVLETIERCVAFLDGSFKMHEIRIELQTSENPMIIGYPAEFTQVLLNILINARDALVAYKGTAPLINIKLFTEENKAVVTIADNAGGIPDKIIDRIFDPYFTTKGPEQGTGIGLFMSKTIIEKNMGGRLSVRNLGDGAEFRIEVDRVQPPPSGR